MKKLLWLFIVSGLFIFLHQPEAISAQGAQFADVTIDTSFPTYMRLGDNCGAEMFPVHYTTEQFTVTVSGEYDFRFRQSAGVPAHAAIYRNFNPASPGADCVDSDGPITQPTVQPRIIVELQVNTTYVMVKSCRYPDIPEFPMPCTWLYDTAFGPGIVQTSGSPEPPVIDPPVDDTPVNEPGDDMPENTEPEPPLFNDDRLDQPEIDKIAVYNRFDADGNPSLHVYCIDANGNGNFWTEITVDKVRDTLQQVDEFIDQGITDPTATNGFEIESNRPAQSTAECPYSLRANYVRTSDLNPEQEPYLEVIIFDPVESKFFRVRLDDLPVLDAAMQPADVSPPSDESPSTTADGIPVATERLENHPFIDKAAIFNGVDADGNPALMFYCVDGQSDVILMGFITQPELAAYMDHVYSEALNNQSSSYVMGYGIYRRSVLSIPYSPPPAGCPYQFSLQAGVGDPIRDADGTIIDYGSQNLVLEVLDTAQRKQHAIFFDLPLPTAIQGTSTFDY